MAPAKHHSTTAAARALGCTSQTVRNLIRRGELKAIHLGTVDRPQFRISDAELKRFIRARKVTPAR